MVIRGKLQQNKDCGLQQREGCDTILVSNLVQKIPKLLSLINIQEYCLTVILGFVKGNLSFINKHKERCTRWWTSVVNLTYLWIMQLVLFHTMVLPVMTYTAEVWGNYIIREISQLQMKFLKHTLYLHKNTNTDIVYGELGE